MSEDGGRRSESIGYGAEGRKETEDGGRMGKPWGWVDARARVLTGLQDLQDS